MKDKKKIKLKDVQALKEPLYKALNGNVAEALKIIESLEQNKMSDLEKEVIQKYKTRFDNPVVDTNSDESKLVNQLLTIYHQYWQKGLLGKFSQMEGLKFLFESLQSIALELGYKTNGFSEDEMEKLTEVIKKELKKQGYYSIMGGVRPFMNLMIWKKESEAIYNIEIGDGKQEVKVVLMDDFLTFGWAGYATFDIFHVGGWAKKDKLFCVKPAYKLESENFKVSYLAHEGRHFADYKIFPKLGGIDLEYRAKLTEILLSTETYEELVDKFLSEAKDDRENPHAYASYLLTENIRKELGLEKSKENILSVPLNQVKDTARKLILKHTKLLKKKGQETVETVF